MPAARTAVAARTARLVGFRLRSFMRLLVVGFVLIRQWRAWPTALEQNPGAGSDGSWYPKARHRIIAGTTHVAIAQFKFGTAAISSLEREK